MDAEHETSLYLPESTASRFQTQLALGPPWACAGRQARLVMRREPFAFALHFLSRFEHEGEGVVSLPVLDAVCK